MIAQQFQSLAWLSYQLGATFTFGVPLLLLIWSYYKKEDSIKRLLSIYWKVSSLMAISILFIIGGQEIGHTTSLIAPFLMLISIWFWVDLNEELKELPPKRPIVFTTHIWRWCLSFWSILFGSLNFMSIECIQSNANNYCNVWSNSSEGLNQSIKIIIKFLFGGNWNESIATFIAYLTLLIYIIGFIQWAVFKLPKYGRFAHHFYN